MKQDENQIVAVWDEGSGEKKIIANMSNKGATVTFYKHGYTGSFGDLKKEFVKDGEGYLYVASDMKKIKIMKTNKIKHTFITFIKTNTISSNSNETTK